MNYAIVVLLIFVLPVCSLLVELLVFGNSAGVFLLIGKWFTFWGVGARLLLAGLRQAIQPRFTAENILGIKSKDAFQAVQELGFANISIGTIGILRIFSSSWAMPSAIAGCLFYGFAGFRHVVKSERNALENTALVSDLFIFAILLLSIAFRIVSGSTS